MNHFLPVCSMSSRAPAVLHMAMASFCLSLSSSLWDEISFLPVLSFISELLSQSPISILKMWLKVLRWRPGYILFSDLQLSRLQHITQESQDPQQECVRLSAESMKCASLVYPVWHVSAALPGCRPKPRQRGLLQSGNRTSAFLSLLSSTRVVLFHRWARGKEGFMPAQSGRWSVTHCNNADTPSLFTCLGC